MPPPEPTPRFQLLINGEVRATAAIGNSGVMNVIVRWIRYDLLRTDISWAGEDYLGVSLGGLDSASREHLRWLDVDLQIGDEVTVRLLPPGASDPPQERRAMGAPAQQKRGRGPLRSRPTGPSRLPRRVFRLPRLLCRLRSR